MTIENNTIDRQTAVVAMTALRYFAAIQSAYSDFFAEWVEPSKKESADNLEKQAEAAYKILSKKFKIHEKSIILNLRIYEAWQDYLDSKKRANAFFSG